ncbi:type II secretion system protein J [Massilia sp. IC2-476]|uniref:PulJ/GspJ family protein n=1 Tax=Massilia sp. IC2-476 TaxID=2887199 RepID=UPI001D11B3C2|nr:hypothetical protein [Massilia sp. IC2-476]MCC2972863.1 hypothetical protein [Massilia sp. IC2-476]
MKMHTPAAGLSYIEVMVALVLLAICALPAADAIRSGLRATEAGAMQARELRCVKNRMETVLAESYDDLWKAVEGSTTPSSYSLAADPGPDGECGVRNVYISKYWHPYGAATGLILSAGNTAEDTLLLVTVSGTDGSYPLTTLVDR